MEPFELPHQHEDASHLHELEEYLRRTEYFQTVALVFRQLSDANRVRLFWLLCHCEECVVNLAAMMGMSPPALSHHLRQLRESGLIVSRRDGKEVYYKAAESEQQNFRPSACAFSMVSPLSAASLGSKLMIYWWLLISPCWVFLPYLRFASRQAVANEKSPHSRVSSR